MGEVWLNVVVGGLKPLLPLVVVILVMKLVHLVAQRWVEINRNRGK